MTAKDETSSSACTSQYRASHNYLDLGMCTILQSLLHPPSFQVQQLREAAFNTVQGRQHRLPKIARCLSRPCELCTQSPHLQVQCCTSRRFLQCRNVNIYNHQFRRGCDVGAEINQRQSQGTLSLPPSMHQHPTHSHQLA